MVEREPDVNASDIKQLIESRAWRYLTFVAYDQIGVIKEMLLTLKVDEEAHNISRKQGEALGIQRFLELPEIILQEIRLEEKENGS